MKALENATASVDAIEAASLARYQSLRELAAIITEAARAADATARLDAALRMELPNRTAGLRSNLQPARAEREKGSPARLRSGDPQPCSACP